MLGRQTTYDRDKAPSKYNEGQEDARPDLPDGNRGGRLEDGIGEEEDQRDDGIGVVDSIHTKLLLHSVWMLAVG